MSVNKTYLNQQCIPFGLPYKYKEIDIYPILMKDYPTWEKNMGILSIEKNYIGSIEIIQMSYLKFLIGLGLEDENILDQLIDIIHIVLRLSKKDYKVEFILGDKTEILIKHNDDSESIIISEQDFEDIKTIILYQNIHGYSDKYINPDIKKAAEEYNKLKSKNMPAISLEKKVIAVCSNTNYQLQEIAEIPIRTFTQLFDMIVEKIDYSILKGAELSGNVTFKQPIEHWIYREEKDPYTAGFVDYEEINRKVQGTV